jgi:hypothetical protein
MPTDLSVLSCGFTTAVSSQHAPLSTLTDKIFYLLLSRSWITPYSHSD